MLTTKEKTYRILMIVMFVFTIGWTIFLLINAGMNQTSSAAASNSVSKVIEDSVNTIAPNTINDTNRESFNFLTRKVIGHFLSFTILGIFISLGFKFLINGFKLNKKRLWIPIVITLIYGLLIAFGTEAIQLAVEGRSGQISDVFIDYGGYALGCLFIVFIFLIIYFCTRQKRKPQNAN